LAICGGDIRALEIDPRYCGTRLQIKCHDGYSEILNGGDVRTADSAGHRRSAPPGRGCDLEGAVRSDVAAKPQSEEPYARTRSQSDRPCPRDYKRLAFALMSGRFAILDWDAVIVGSSRQHEAVWECTAREENRPLPPGMRIVAVATTHAAETLGGADLVVPRPSDLRLADIAAWFR
jgi:hypothetical protein